jgi:hypothetical protein
MSTTAICVLAIYWSLAFALAALYLFLRSDRGQKWLLDPHRKHFIM